MLTPTRRSQTNDKHRNRRTRRGFGITLTGGRFNSDGSTSAIVTYMEPGGDADKSGLCLGDEVVQWNGHSLVNATYETTRNIVGNETSDKAEILVTTVKKKLNVSVLRCGQEYRCPWSVNPEYGSLRKTTPGRSTCPPLVHLEGKIEQVAVTPAGGELELAVTYDVSTATVTVKVSRAACIPYRPGQDKALPCCFVQMYMHPKSNIVSTVNCRTLYGVVSFAVQTVLSPE
ncbi:hypothetical protein LSAT2_031764 [Lamellibrachia satsuma]|nr:hypothetical protein LSAT2_031764 [Lamellibrachia satsuma]